MKLILLTILLALVFPMKTLASGSVFGIYQMTGSRTGDCYVAMTPNLKDSNRINMTAIACGGSDGTVTYKKLTDGVYSYDSSRGFILRATTVGFEFVNSSTDEVQWTLTPKTDWTQ